MKITKELKEDIKKKDFSEIFHSEKPWTKEERKEFKRRWRETIKTFIPN